MRRRAGLENTTAGHAPQGMPAVSSPTFGERVKEWSSDYFKEVLKSGMKSENIRNCFFPKDFRVPSGPRDRANATFHHRKVGEHNEKILRRSVDTAASCIRSRFGSGQRRIERNCFRCQRRVDSRGRGNG